MQTFKEWLRASLDDRHWTGGDLERASGVSNSIIWRWLADPPRRPSDTNLKRIAPALGVAYEDLAKLCGYSTGEPSAPLDPGKAEWNALYDQMAADLRGTVVSMVRAAANTSDEPTAKHSGQPVNGRRRGQQPPLQSRKPWPALVHAAALMLPILRLRPALALPVAATA